MENGTCISEMLFSTSLVALVGAGEQPHFSSRKLQITNTKRNTTICELNYPTAIQAVKLNRKRMAVVLESHIHIYDVTNMKILHSIQVQTGGVFAMSPSSDSCYIAYPTAQQSGEVVLFDAVSLQSISITQAHKSLVNSMAFNFDGSLLATASDKGTIIRVFSVPEMKKLYQFRRGTYPANIISMNFNLQSNLLCVSASDTDTVHIFKLVESKPSMIKSMLPGMINEAWEPARHFAYAKVPKAGSICAISNSLLYVVTSEGYFYHYSLNPEEGGECQVLKQYNLADDEL